MLNAFSGVATIFLIGLLGYLLARGKWVGPEIKFYLPRFVTLIVLPPYLLRAMTTSLEREQLIHLLAGIGIPFLSILATFFLAILLSHILKVPPLRKGIFQTAFATSNTMLIGLPINIALFGESSIPYVLLYYFGNTVFFWTIGTYTISHSGDSATIRMFSRQTLKQILSPPLMGFICGLILVYFEIRLPDFLDKTCKYIGDMAVALGTMYVGMIIEETDLRKNTLDRDTLVVFFGRFIAAPLSILLICRFMPVSPLMRNVLLIQSSLPVMLNVTILAAFYKADVPFAAKLTSLSTVLSLATIPLYMFLISAFLS